MLFLFGLKRFHLTLFFKHVFKCVFWSTVTVVVLWLDKKKTRGAYNCHCIADWEEYVFGVCR